MLVHTEINTVQHKPVTSHTEMIHQGWPVLKVTTNPLSTLDVLHICPLQFTLNPLHLWRYSTSDAINLIVFQTGPEPVHFKVCLLGVHTHSKA